MSKNEILFELIKFDMAQIRLYAEAILNISSMSVIASFAISAFVYGKSTPPADVSVHARRKILLTTHMLILVILGFSMYFYYCGIDASRLVMEKRECSLRNYVGSTNQEIGPDELYPQMPDSEEKRQPSPVDEMYKKCGVSNQPRINSYLEKYPIFLAIILIFIKMAFEICWPQNRPQPPQSQ